MLNQKTMNNSQHYFGRYKIIEEIQSGGMGKVYKAKDPKLDRVVALKVLLSGDFARPDEIARFSREAKAMAKLQHPNIVGVYDIGDEDGKTIRNAVNIMTKVGEAVHYAHRQGIIHRDLKPANILMDKGSEPKVTDFGIAKVIQESKKLSKSGDILGTLQYMPPEQADAKFVLLMSAVMSILWEQHFMNC